MTKLKSIRNMAYFGLVLNAIAMIMFSAVVTNVNVIFSFRIISVIGFILFCACEIFYIKIISIYNNVLEP
jgi:hypothetical protein